MHCKRWVRVLNNTNRADYDQHTANLRVQVFLAYAAAADPNDSPELVASTAAAVEHLRRLLAQARITYWECPHPWPPSIDAEAAISRATEACDNYVMVLSPRSITNAHCLQGLLFALSLNKRIVPVLTETVPTDHLPEPLQNLATIDLRTTTFPLEQSQAGDQLLQTLRHEADYHQAHTQLLLKALQWERQLRDPTLLLQGEDLVWYQRWLPGANRRSRHCPIQLQTLYVVESARRSPSAQSQSRQWLKRWLN